jgi:hypothetical protein
MHLIDFFTGGEKSWIEYVHVLLLLVMILYAARKLVADYLSLHETFLINTVVAGLLFLVLGRELSYGKYHGIDDRGLRTILRVLSFAAVIGLWVWAALFARAKIRSAASAGIRRVRGEWVLIALTGVVLVISQLVDKDIFYVIRPAEIAQLIEECLETLAYILLIWILVRLNDNQSNG